MPWTPEYRQARVEYDSSLEFIPYVLPQVTYRYTLPSDINRLDLHTPEFLNSGHEIEVSKPEPKKGFAAFIQEKGL